MTGRKALLYVTQSKLLKQDWVKMKFFPLCTWEHKPICAAFRSVTRAITIKLCPVLVHSRRRETKNHKVFEHARFSINTQPLHAWKEKALSKAINGENGSTYSPSTDTDKTTQVMGFKSW